ALASTTGGVAVHWAAVRGVAVRCAAVRRATAPCAAVGCVTALPMAPRLIVPLLVPTAVHFIEVHVHHRAVAEKQPVIRPVDGPGPPPSFVDAPHIQHLLHPVPIGRSVPSRPDPPGPAGAREGRLRAKGDGHARAVRLHIQAAGFVYGSYSTRANRLSGTRDHGSTSTNRWIGEYP